MKMKLLMKMTQILFENENNSYKRKDDDLER